MSQVTSSSVVEWAKDFLNKAKSELTPEEVKEQKKFASLVQTPEYKTFLSKMLDESSQIRNNSKLNKRVLILGTGGLSHEPPVPLLAGAPDEIAEFLIAGRNPTPEFRAARQARTLATGQIFGTPECPLTPLNPEWDQNFMRQMLEGRLSEVDDFDIEDISRQAGRSTHEIRTWIAAFAALAAHGPYRGRQDYYRPINEWIAGYGMLSAELI